MRHPVPQDVLTHVRERAKMSQAAVASAMGTVPSVLSKLQRAEEVEPQLAERYLSAVGSALADEVREFYSRDWRMPGRPSFLHPDRETLWQIDQAVHKLSRFEDGPKFHSILRGPVDLLRGELTATHNYLLRRDHTVAWVGDIGVGKTTALAHAVGLLVGDGRSQRRPAFPTGAGRTTICETEIRVSPTFGVAIEPLSHDEVVRLTHEMVTALAPRSTGGGVPAELNRALRAMADMRFRRTLNLDDEVEMVDPIKELLDGGLGIDETVDRVVAAMRLADRKERQALLPEGSLDGLSWLSTLVSKINNGQHADFSIPRRVTVLTPSENLDADGQVLSVVDTRGLEGTTQRSDIIEHRDDSRTLVVLCAKFADAPGTSITRIIEDTRSVGSDAWERNRLCLLVLPRGDESLQLPGLDEPPQSRQEGYAIRRQDIRQALIKANAQNMPIYFFDAHADDPSKIWQQLRGQVALMRQAYAARALTACDGVKNLLENVNLVRTTEARRKIERDTDILLDQVNVLPASIRPPHVNLLDQLNIAHPSSVAASMGRGGDWDNFNISSILGTGVRIDAHTRTESHMQRMRFKLEEFEKEHSELRDVVNSVQLLHELLASARQDFLRAARVIGADAYGSLLSKTRRVWKKSEDRYGGGPGYKRDVAGYWKEFFESGDEEHLATRSAIDRRLQAAWEQYVLTMLRENTRSDRRKLHN